jgi:hypothetical protein
LFSFQTSSRCVCSRNNFEFERRMNIAVIIIILLFLASSVVGKAVRCILLLLISIVVIVVTRSSTVGVGARSRGSGGDINASKVLVGLITISGLGGGSGRALVVDIVALGGGRKRTAVVVVIFLVMMKIGKVISRSGHLVFFFEKGDFFCFCFLRDKKRDFFFFEGKRRLRYSIDRKSQTQ